MEIGNVDDEFIEEAMNFTMKKIILAISMLLLVSTASAQGLSGFLGGLFGKK